MQRNSTKKELLDKKQSSKYGLTHQIIRYNFTVKIMRQPVSNNGKFLLQLIYTQQYQDPVSAAIFLHKTHGK